jgi:hypothetical protein
MWHAPTTGDALGQTQSHATSFTPRGLGVSYQPSVYPKTAIGLENAVQKTNGSDAQNQSPELPSPGLSHAYKSNDRYSPT